MKLTYSINIHADINKVFTYLDDNLKQKLWLANFIEIIPLPREKFQSGEPFLLKMQEGLEVKEYKGYLLNKQNPVFKHFTIEVESNKLSIENLYYLSSIDANTTKLSYVAVYRIKSLILKITMMLNYPLFYAPFIKTSISAQLKKLKQLAEAENRK
ncbi:MAG: SRPBCC family protein [Alphaproteobacteria bacterium]|nr:SRPBCC family protein [Alphaproteobacteria bacterium]